MVYECRFKNAFGGNWTGWTYTRDLDTVEQLVSACLDNKRTITEDKKGKSVTLWAPDYDYEFREKDSQKVVWRGCKKRDGVNPKIIQGFYHDGTACEPVEGLLLALAYVRPARRRFRSA